MKRFICYLYEYQDGKRIRNMGFSKVETEEAGCTVSVHGKGWGMNSPQSLSLYLFYRENGHCYGIYQGELTGISPALNCRLVYNTEDTGGQERFDRIEGIILCQDQVPRYAAVWTDAAVDISTMETAPENTGNQEKKEEEEPEEAAEPEKESELAEPIKAAGSAELEEPAESAERTEAVETAELADFFEPAGASGKTETQWKKEEEPSGRIVEARELYADKKEELSGQEFVETRQLRCTKIKRQDISRLVRREWHLANNSFLLHGYYNYHHLAFIEEDEELYLGVPGICCEREQRAAQAFGFPGFIRFEDDMMTLLDAEKEEDPAFGYWCRRVHRIM